jgi:transposase
VFLQQQGELVLEIDRPRRPTRRDHAKSDELDAIRAAREALTREHLAQPRQRGEREALRVLLATRHSAVRSKRAAITLMKGLLVSAAPSLREGLRALPTREQLARCARLRVNPAQSSEQRATIIAIRASARRALALAEEALELEREIEPIVARLAPALLQEMGVGPIVAAQILCTYSHPGRIRSEAAFAALAGVAPLPASSGQTVRHRLNRSGDRQLNRALHTIVLCRMRDDPQTRAYTARRQAEGRSTREIKRCLKRYTARHLYRLLNATPQIPANSET